MDMQGIVFEPEFVFRASRSGGAGGQNVNKVNTKVELEFDVINSRLLTDEQRGMVLAKLQSRITKEGLLKIVVQEERSQLANKEIAIKKFYMLINSCFVRRKRRKPTKPGKAAKERRLKFKKKTSDIKKQRRGKW